jgi:anion-transporting  ArsA/GET3 family ATPase
VIDDSVSLSAVVDGASVVVCCGSGGVGKTTAAAAIGIEAARRGRRVVVVTIDPARRLADALGLADGLGPEPRAIDTPDSRSDGTSGELWAMMLDPAATFDAIVRRYAADDAQAERILANSFFRNMATSLSGTQEYMAAETLYMLHRDDRFDLVVVDTPPTRNALDFLEAPGVLARFLDHRLFRLLMLPARRGMRVMNVATQPMLRAIGRVVGSDVLADAVAFFQSFAGMEGGFRERADEVIGLLRSDATRFVVVASPRRETIAEAVWFTGQLGEQGIGQIAGVVNRVDPGLGHGSSADASARAASAVAAGDTAAAALWSNLAELRAVREGEFVELATFTDHFGDRGCVEVPLLAADVHDRAGLAHVGRYLFGHSDES